MSSNFWDTCSRIKWKPISICLVRAWTTTFVDKYLALIKLAHPYVYRRWMRNPQFIHQKFLYPHDLRCCICQGIELYSVLGLKIVACFQAPQYTKSESTNTKTTIDLLSSRYPPQTAPEKAPTNVVLGIVNLSPFGIVPLTHLRILLVIEKDVSDRVRVDTLNLQQCFYSLVVILLSTRRSMAER